MRICESRRGILVLSSQAAQRRAARIGDKIPRNAARRIGARDPFFQRHCLCNFTVNHHRAKLITLGCFTHNNRRFHLTRDSHHRTRLT